MCSSSRYSLPRGEQAARDGEDRRQTSQGEVMGRLVHTSGPMGTVDIDDLAPGIYGADERWLSDKQVVEIADHVCAIPRIWNLMREITDEDRIEGELEMVLWTEVREYIMRNGWVAAGGDTFALTRILRKRATNFQNTKI